MNQTAVNNINNGFIRLAAGIVLLVSGFAIHGFITPFMIGSIIPLIALTLVTISILVGGLASMGYGCYMMGNGIYQVIQELTDTVTDLKNKLVGAANQAANNAVNKAKETTRNVNQTA